MKNEFQKMDSGITLIALVITIIVLLILAGVTIATLTGENGLLNRAKSAKESSQNSQIEENTTLADYENKVEDYVDGSRNNVLYNIFPDYASKTKFTFIDKSYTAQNDCYIQVNFDYLNTIADSEDGLNINNTLVYYNSERDDWNNKSTPLLLVKAGDTITYYGKAQRVTGYYYLFR